VEIRHPRGGPPLGLLERTGCAVATSGDYARGRVHEGVRYSPVFDPATGRPRSGGLVSVTVASPASCMQADAVATALIALGPEAAERFLADRAGDLFRDGLEVWWAEERADGELAFSRLLLPGPGIHAAGARADSPVPARRPGSRGDGAAAPAGP
jgi:hypothetical protein